MDHAADCEPLEEYGKSNGDIEAQWSIIYRPHCKNIVLCNVYRPPTGDLVKAIAYLDETLKLFELDRVEIFMMGDLNVNYKNKSSREFKKLSFFTKSNGLSQVIQNTTRNSDKSNSLLDVVLTNSKYISNAGTLDHFISDHQPVFEVKKKGRDHRPNKNFRGRSYRNYVRETFKHNLLEQNWEDFYKMADPNEAWTYLLGRIILILDRMCPIRTFQIKNYMPEWVTNELIEQIKDRDYFYKKAKLEGGEDAWNIAKHLRNLTNTNIRQARKDFVLSELEENRDDYKRFWKTVRSVIPNEKGSTKQDISLTHMGQKLAKQDIAHFINNYFINIGKNNRGTSQGSHGNDGAVRAPQVNTVNCADSSVNSGEWSFDDIPQAEVYKVIKGINVSKSLGLDDVSSFIVKEAFTILLAQITHLFNLSLHTSIFPKDWKGALVIPIPKTGNLSNVQNYRPISLLPLPGKLLEKLVHAQLSSHLDNINFLTDNQHGFRKQHSTIHSIAQITKFINTKMDKGQVTLAAFIDFRKAFDCVQHPILLDKLSCTGLGNNALKWFESYLTGRRQRVLANNVHSQYQVVTQGVPQGSVLGPLFYIIYANDINKIIKSCNIALYADDTVLYTASANFDVSTRKIQKDMNALSVWCEQNGIRMNTDKTKLMVFGSPVKISKLPDFEIKIEGSPLTVATHYKYLGITLDRQLNYTKHIQTVISKVSLKLKQFRRMRYFLDVKAATLVYKNMILPIIEYGDIFLVGTTAENRKKLQILQNKGLRCALREQDTSINKLHRKVQLQRLKYRRDQHLLSYMYDVATDDKQHKPKTCSIKTRSHNKKLLKICRPKTEKFKNSLAYRGPKKWNSLPEQYHHVTTRQQFNCKIKHLYKVGLDLIKEEAVKGK